MSEIRWRVLECVANVQKPRAVFIVKNVKTRGKHMAIRKSDETPLKPNETSCKPDKTVAFNCNEGPMKCGRKKDNIVRTIPNHLRNESL